MGVEKGTKMKYKITCEKEYGKNNSYRGQIRENIYLQWIPFKRKIKTFEKSFKHTFEG